jgi:pyruvate dehydrogenase E2 component (dihydrolipoamide acetyltransferase)
LQDIDVMVEIRVPQIGEAASELTLVNWIKAVGDVVHKGEVLFEVDSDKAIVEVEAYIDGTLVEILVPAGSSIMPLQVVGQLLPVQEEKESSPPAIDSHPQEQSVSPAVQRPAADLGVTPDQAISSGSGGQITVADVRSRAASGDGNSAERTRVIASPKARRLARERNIDLRSIAGAGHDGMIHARDIETATAPDSVGAFNIETDNIVPASKSRRVTAARMLQSKQTVPHFYLMVDVDMTQVITLRNYCTEKLGWERPPTYTDVLIRACAVALAKLPEVNRSYSERGIITRSRIAIGVAVNTNDGLVVPVIPDADRMTLRETSTLLRELAVRAREGRLRSGDMSAKSLVISNLGAHQVDAFIAIIDPPDPIILAVGRVAEHAVPVDGQVVIRPMCTLSLSVDHRVLDGVQGARYLEQVKEQLDYPFELLG